MTAKKRLKNNRVEHCFNHCVLVVQNSSMIDEDKKLITAFLEIAKEVFKEVSPSRLTEKTLIVALRNGISENDEQSSI